MEKFSIFLEKFSKCLAEYISKCYLAAMGKSIKKRVCPEDLYTLSEYSKLTGTPPSTVHRMMHDTKTLDTVKVNGTTLIHAKDLSKKQ